MQKKANIIARPELRAVRHEDAAVAEVRRTSQPLRLTPYLNTLLGLGRPTVHVDLPEVATRQAAAL